MVLNMKKHFIKQKKITVENHRQSFQNTLNMIQPQEIPQLATQETAFSVPPFSTRDNPQETPPTCESDGYYWDNAGLSLFSYAAHSGAVSSEILPGDPYAMYAHGNQDWSQDASAFNCFGSRFTYIAEQSTAQILTEVGVQTVPANARSGTQKEKYLRDQQSQDNYSHTSFQTPFLPHQYFNPEQPIITSSTLETRSPTNLTDVPLRDRHSSEQLAVRSSALLSESHASLQHESCVSPATTYLPGRILPRFGEQFSTNKTGYPGLVPSNLEHLPNSSIHSKGLLPSTRLIPLTSKQHDVTPGKGLYSGEDCSSTSERKRAIFKAALNGDPENYRFNQRRR